MLRLLTHTTKIAVLTAGLAFGGAVAMAQAQTAVPEGPSALTETYGDWVVRCATATAVEGQPAPARVCEMTQELRQQANNQRLLALALQATEAGEALTVIAPFGLLLSEGVKIEIADTQILATPFRTCMPGGCIATADLDAASIAAFGEGAEAVVVMIDTTKQELRIKVSLKGFNAALDRLKAL